MVTASEHFLQGVHSSLSVRNYDKGTSGPVFWQFCGLFEPKFCKLTVILLKFVQFTTLCHLSPEPLVEIVQ
jgi:hypothetical protein